MKTSTSTRLLSLLLALMMIVTILPTQFAKAAPGDKYELHVKQMSTASFSQITNNGSAVNWSNVFKLDGENKISLTNEFKLADKELCFVYNNNKVEDGAVNNMIDASNIGRYNIFADYKASTDPTGAGTFTLTGKNLAGEPTSVEVKVIVDTAVAEDISVNVTVGVETMIPYTYLEEKAEELWGMSVSSIKITQIAYPQIAYPETVGKFTYGDNRFAVSDGISGIKCDPAEGLYFTTTQTFDGTKTATYTAEVEFDGVKCVYIGKINMTSSVFNTTVNLPVNEVYEYNATNAKTDTKYWIYKENVNGSVRRNYVSGVASFTVADIEKQLGNAIKINNLTIKTFTVARNNVGIYKEEQREYYYHTQTIKDSDEEYSKGIEYKTISMLPEEGNKDFPAASGNIFVYINDISSSAYIECVAETNGGVYNIRINFNTKSGSSVSVNAYPYTSNSIAPVANSGFGHKMGIFRIPVLDIASACGVSTNDFKDGKFYVYATSASAVENYIEYASANKYLFDSPTFENLEMADSDVTTALTYYYEYDGKVVKGTLTISPASGTKVSNIEKNLFYAKTSDYTNFTIDVTFAEICADCGLAADSDKIDVFFSQDAKKNIKSVTRKDDGSAPYYEFALVDPLESCNVNFVVSTNDTSHPFKYNGTINFVANTYKATDIDIKLGEKDSVANISITDIYNACGIGTNIIYTNDVSVEGSNYFPRVRFTSIPSAISNVYANDKKTGGDILKKNLGVGDYSYIYSTTSYEAVPSASCTGATTLTYEIDILYTLNKGEVLPDGSAAADKTMQVLCRYTGNIIVTPYAEKKPVETRNASGDLNYKISANNKKASGIIGDIAAKCENKSVTGVVFTFTSSDVTIKLGNEEIESGKEYNVLNNSAFTFEVKNYTSDIRIYYTAKTEGINYNGSIKLEKVKTVEVATVSKFAIFNGTAKNYNAEIKVSDFGIAENITEFKVKSVIYKTTAAANTGRDNIAGSAEYGYLTTTDNGRTAVSTFAANSVLYYNPGRTAGVVEIQYVGYSATAEYTGKVVVTVYNGADQDVILNLKSRDPYRITDESKDKSVFAKTLLEKVMASLNDKTVTLSYVTFDAPLNINAKYGTLYSSDNFDALVTSSSTTVNGYYFDKAVAGKATLPANALYYVPTDLAGTYAIDYTVGVILNNVTYELRGTLAFVTAADILVTGDVIYNTTNGMSVYFDTEDFQSYVKTRNSKYVLKSLVINEVPTIGTLTNGTTVLTNANLTNIYNASGSGSTINKLCYTPKGYNYYETIKFTATVALTSTSSTTTNISGTILIVVTKGMIEDITYSVNSNGTLNMKAGDFYSVCTNATGATLDHVYFDIGSVAGGTLYYNTVSKNNKVQSNTVVYYNSSKTPNLANIIFDPSAKSSTVTIPYSVYTSGGTFLYTGFVKVNIFTEVQTPNFRNCVKSAQKILFNGKEITLDAYLIDDYNYVKLRDIAYIMNGTGSQFGVSYDTKNVYCESGKAYIPTETDMQTGVDKSSTCRVSSFTVYVDDIYQSAYVYNIGGNNYFKLRDLGAILGFEVDWDEKNGIVIINSSDYRGN